MTAPAKSPWTPERIETLTAMWTDGKADGDWALALGNGISRSAIIGKVFRLGLQRSHSGRTTLRPAPGPRRLFSKPSAPKLWDGPEDEDLKEWRAIEAEMPVRAHRPKRHPVSLAGDSDVTVLTDRRIYNHRPDRPRADIVPLPPSAVWNPLPGIKPIKQGTLSPRTCRWPVEDGKDRFGADRLCCGADSPLGEPYCETHANQSLPAAKRRAA